MKTLFFHNTMAEYRIGFFEMLDKKMSLKIVFTDFDQGNLIYNNNLSSNSIIEKSVILDGGKICRIKKAIKYIKENEYDWIVLPTLDDVYSIVLSLFILINKGKSKICYFWEKWESPKDKQTFKRRIQEFMLKVLVRPILKNVEIALYPGKKTKEYYDNLHIPNLKTARIHDVSLMKEDSRFDIRKRYGINEDKKIILFLGRIVKIKGLDTLLYAVDKCGKDFLEKNVLIVAGNGDELSYNKKLAEQLKLKNVYFVGRISSEDRYTFFEASDIFVLPDRYLNGRVDAWGLTVNEALQCGCYVIVSTAAGAAYDLINDKNGTVYEESNIDELANALMRCNEDIVIENARKQKENFVKEYNYETMAEDFKSALEYWK